jgi:transposase InsO family protein
VLRRPVEPGQYTSTEFARFCTGNQIRASVGRTGLCWDNAAAESFFATLKNEMYYRQGFDTRKMAEQAEVVFDVVASRRRCR